MKQYLITTEHTIKGYKLIKASCEQEAREKAEQITPANLEAQIYKENSINVTNVILTPEE